MIEYAGKGVNSYNGAPAGKKSGGSYPRLNGETFYKGLETDPIRAIVSTFVHNLSTQNYHLAKEDYAKLVSTIRKRGQTFKDINYAYKQLGILAKYAEAGAEDIKNFAEKYIRLLPKPSGKRTPQQRGLESLVA